MFELFVYDCDKLIVVLLDYGVFVNGLYGFKNLFLFVVLEMEYYGIVYIFLKYGVDLFGICCLRVIGFYYCEVIMFLYDIVLVIVFFYMNLIYIDEIYV